MRRWIRAGNTVGAVFVFASLLLAASASGRAQCLACLGDAQTSAAGRLIVTNPQNRTLTIHPDGSGDFPAALGIGLEVHVWCERVGDSLGLICSVPAEDIVLWNSSLCWCSLWHADRPSGDTGVTRFTTPPRGGGCATTLQLFVDGNFAGSVAFRINSPDTGQESACGVDGSDLAGLAARLGHPEIYSYCFDYNEDGFTDAGDIAYFASIIGSQCIP